MTLAAPLFLLAALAAVIPVVIHMINRQRAKELPFSTLRFLRISVEKTRNRRRIHDVFLMLLRMAVLILIAMALAGPTVTNLAALFGGGATSAVAIILDNSASMGVMDSGSRRFDVALGAARQIMDQLQPGDRVCLFITSGIDPRKKEQRGKLDRTHETVRQAIEQVQLSYERADLPPWIQQARKVLAEAEAPNKQIFVITDLQSLGWQSFLDSQAGGDRKRPGESASSTDQKRPAGKSASSAGAESAPDREKETAIPIIFVDCHRAPKPNVAIQDVEFQAAVPVAGLPVKASATLFNAASVAQQRHVELVVDGQKKATSPAIKVAPGATAKHAFTFAFDGGGLHRCEVRLAGDDGSAMDDKRFFTVEIDQGIPVAVVKSAAHEIRYLEDTFYLENALDAGRQGGSAIRPTPLAAADLAGETFSRYTVIFLVNLPAVDQALAAKLKSYVENGGNLVWVCGDNVDPAAYNAMNAGAGKTLLPLPLLDVRAPGAQDAVTSWHIGFLDKEHRALSHLVEPASIYQSVLVYRHVRMDAQGADGARVLARLNDGEPLLAERNVGEGSVTMLGTSCHIGWTNLPLRPMFLPLVARLTFELAGTEQARHQAIAGTPLVLQFEEQMRPLGVEVIPPSGDTIRLDLQDLMQSTAHGSGEEGASGAATTASAREFRYGETHAVGVYLVRLLEAARPTQVAFSVNPDADEAKDDKIARQTLEEKYRPTPLVFAEDPEDLSSTFAWLREGNSLWGAFLFAVLFVLVFESFVSNFLNPKKEDEAIQKTPIGMRPLPRPAPGKA